MRLTGAKKQTAFLTAVNGVVRALGLLMRVLLSRLMGAEIMGIMELSSSVHMVAITPLTSGLPTAISRMTAKAAPANQAKPLMAGLWMARVGSAALIPMLWLLSPLIARAMGDVRVLPSLWFTAPCILILGYSAAYNGYCYGIGQSTLPALSELIEQLGRFLFTFALLWAFRHLTAGWMAAVPTVATMAAEMLGLVYVMHRLPIFPPDGSEVYRKPVFRLAFPSTLTRLAQTVLRSLTALLIPLRLQQSGLCAAEATSRLGMLNGMVLPILMLPCIFTSAISMVALPRIAQAEENPAELRRLLTQCLLGCVPVSLACSLAIFLASKLLAVSVYRLPELSVLFRRCAPLTVLLALGHLAGSVLSALGQQKRMFYASCLVSCATLGLTWLWAGDPAQRLMGVVRAQYVSHLLSIALSVGIFLIWRRRRIPAGDKSA